MTTHPRYQYKLEDLFQTDSSGHSIRLYRWLKPYQKLLPQQPAQKARRTPYYCSRRRDPLKVGFAGYESTWYWIVNQLFREL